MITRLLQKTLTSDQNSIQELLKTNVEGSVEEIVEELEKIDEEAEILLDTTYTICKGYREDIVVGKSLQSRLKTQRYLVEFEYAPVIVSQLVNKIKENGKIIKSFAINRNVDI